MILCNLHTRLGVDNFEENIQNNNWEIWNHHHHEKTVEIVKGSHTPVIGSNFASHNASCFEDSKRQSETYERTQQNPVILSTQILPLAVVWCASDAICTMYFFLLSSLAWFKKLLCFKELLNLVNYLNHTDTGGGKKKHLKEKRKRIVAHRLGESRL